MKKEYVKIGDHTFEVFRGYGQKQGLKGISIHKSYVYLGKALVERAFNGELPKFVTLFYDKENKAVKILPSQESEEGSIKVKSNRYVLTNFWRMMPTGRYLFKKVDEDGGAICFLKE